MATLTQNSSQPASSPLPRDLEPDDEWKQALKVNIEAGLRSMVDEAKQKLNDELAKGIIGPDERERLTADHLATLKTIRQLAEEQFRIALERERQERRWASGEQLDQAWSESMMKEQQAILDRIERERKNKASATTLTSVSSFHSDQPHPPPPPPPPPPPSLPPKPEALSENPTSTPVPSNRKPISRTPTQILDTERDSGSTYFSRSVNCERDDLATSPEDVPAFRSTRKVRAGSTTSIGSWKPPSVLDTEKSFLDRGKPSLIYDEPESMPRSARTPTDPLDPSRKESIRRKPSMTARPIVQEFWKPSITPEEDAQMSRTFTLARRSSTASATSSFKAPSVLSAAFTDPLDVMSSSNANATSSTFPNHNHNHNHNHSSSGNLDRERSSIHSADQEWVNLDRARERDRERDKYPHADDRSVHSISLSTVPPTSVAYARASGDTSRVHAPPPSASRPIATKRSFTIDDSFPSQSSPSTRNWGPVSRSSYDTRWDGANARSPQTPEEVARSWQSSQLRGRFSSQDMRHYFQQEGSYYGSRHVHTHTHHEDFEDGSDDGFDNRSWRARGDYTERRIQDIEEGLRKREEAANRREEELTRKAEELRREDEVRKKRVEEQKREEEARRLEDEARQRDEDEAERKAAELRRKEEEANRREREAAMKEEEARRLEEEARRKEEDAKRKEQDAKKKERDARLKEEDAKRKEKEARSREMEARRKEEEVRKKEKEANSREMEARRKEEEARRKEEEVRAMEEDARRKEYEARRKQEEAERKEEEARLRAEETRRKEEELRKREEELRRREEDLNRRETEMRHREGDRLQEEFRRREEDIRRQRTEERKKQEVWETWPPETFRPTPSPQTPNSSGPWPIPNRTERSASSAASPPTSTSASGRSNPTSGWSTASTRPSSTASTQASSTPKPTGPTPTAKPPTSSTPNTPLTEAEFHRRQAEQAQQREEQFRREQARLAMQEHERQAKSGKTMSKEETLKLFESHRGQWDKMQTLGSLIWEDFPWPMFKRPKGPDDLSSPAITAYMLSAVHPQDRATKERIRDNIRRWHPDRFNSQLLLKVKEDERDRVSEGAGAVARILNDLLRMHSQDTF